MSRRPAWAAFALIVLIPLGAAACVHSTAPHFCVADLRGTWVSGLSSQFAVLALEPSGGEVRGSAEVDARQTYSVRGTYRPPALHLILEGPRQAELEGTGCGDTLDATWSGGPYDGRRILLVRQ